MQKLSEKIDQIKNKFRQALKAAKTSQDLHDIHIQFFGKKGLITELLGKLKKLSAEEKRTFGPILNRLKQETQAKFHAIQESIATQEVEAFEQKKQHFDVTAYKTGTIKGRLHPYSRIFEEIENIFISMGYEVLYGNEVESEHYNFTTLNIPEDHPARDMYDTFWLTKPGMLLRTHTSNMQVRTMETHSLPIAIIVPGRCYRHEATDSSHDFMFQQCEGFLVGKNITLSNLFATAKHFFQALFKKEDLIIRTRPGFFPFVEPGVEIDIRCPFCTSGCSVCKKSTWIEVFPGGLIHPNVLKAGGLDPTVYSGFAFGFGLTRLTMIKYDINDIRLLHGGNMKFLEQF